MVLRNRKGAMESQFNWVFVMIAGSLILVFFFGIVQKQREMSDTKIANTLLTSLESIATGAGVSRGTAQSVQMPRVGINFECSEECTCEYSIMELSKDFEDKIIFSPRIVEGNEIIFWTIDWTVPFRVTNFVFATNPQTKYYFVSTSQSRNSNMFRFINKSIPQRINADFIDFSRYTKVENRNFPSARFIFIDTPTPSMQSIDRSFSNVDVNGLHLNPTGQAVFFDKTSGRSLSFSTHTSGYYGDASIFGTIFAHDFNMYECNMIRALMRLSKIADLYHHRTMELNAANDNETIGGFCPTGYNPDAFAQLSAAATGAANDLKNIGNLQGPVSTIESLNENHLRMACPLIY